MAALETRATHSIGRLWNPFRGLAWPGLVCPGFIPTMCCRLPLPTDSMCFPAALRISLLALGVVAGDLTPPFPPTSTEVAVVPVPLPLPADPSTLSPLTILRICCRGHCIRNVLHTFAGSGGGSRKKPEIHRNKKNTVAAIKMEIDASGKRDGQNENSHNNSRAEGA